MAEPKESSKSVELPPPPFIEVTCKSSGIVRRFSPGTKSGFAISLINNKLDAASPHALYIEAVKSGEEPINFGPSSVLQSYGNDWKLQTVLDSQQATKEGDDDQALNAGEKRQDSELALNYLYIGKIFVALLFIFLLGTIFTLALENLPKLVLFINSLSST